MFRVLPDQECTSTVQHAPGTARRVHKHTRMCVKAYVPVQHTSFFRSSQIRLCRNSMDTLSSSLSLVPCCSQTLNRFLPKNSGCFSSSAARPCSFQCQITSFLHRTLVVCKDNLLQNVSVFQPRHDKTKYSLISQTLIAHYRSHLELGSTTVTAIETAIENEQAGV